MGDMVPSGVAVGQGWEVKLPDIPRSLPDALDMASWWPGDKMALLSFSPPPLLMELKEPAPNGAEVLLTDEKLPNVELDGTGALLELSSPAEKIPWFWMGSPCKAPDVC